MASPDGMDRVLLSVKSSSPYVNGLHLICGSSNTFQGSTVSFDVDKPCRAESSTAPPPAGHYLLFSVFSTL